MTNVRPHNLSNLSYSIATIIINNHMLSSESTLTAGSSRLGVYIGVVSLSAIGIFGAVRYFKIWQQTIRTHKHDAEVRRRQEEEIRSLRCSLSEHRAEMEDEKKASASLKEEVGRLEKKARDAEVDMDASRRQNQTLTNKIKALTTQNKQLEVDSQKMATELGQVKDLLDSRSRALRAAQTFLTKADQIAGADVIKLVEQLNAEILQTAANMAEAFAIEEKKINSEGKEQESDDARLATARTEEIIGSRLTELLRTSEHHEDPILVQTAFQTGMAAYAHWMISSWCFESPEDEHMLSEIYARVREAEEQAVSGRWRQLTRTHLQRMLAQEPDLLPDLAEALANILVAAGYKEGPANSHQQIMSRFSNRIGTVMKFARDLNKTVGEGVTSCDLEVLYIPPDIPYHPGNMSDALGASPNNCSENVICTTDLGLVRAERLSGTVAHWNESVLLKPKVILPSGVAAFAGSTES